MAKIPLDKDFLYDSLSRVLRGAYDQASKGKGKERHACNEAFENQKICVINRWIKDSPVSGALFQVIKKAAESSRLEPSAAIHELRGAINYLAAAILLLEEQIPEEETVHSHIDVVMDGPGAKLCTNCRNRYSSLNEMPCKKCHMWEFRPHFRPRAQAHCSP